MANLTFIHAKIIALTRKESLFIIYMFIILSPRISIIFFSEIVQSNYQYSIGRNTYFTALNSTEIASEITLNYNALFVKSGDKDSKYLEKNSTERYYGL